MASSFATKTNPFHIFLTIPTVICVDISTPARMQLQPVHRLIGDRADLFSLVALPESAGGPVIQGSGAGGFQALETPHFGLLWFLGSSVLQVRRQNRNDRGDLYRRGEGIFGELLSLCSMYDCIIYQGHGSTTVKLCKIITVVQISTRRLVSIPHTGK